MIIQSHKGGANIDVLPNKCPWCHHTIVPSVEYSFYNEAKEQFEIGRAHV